MIGVPLWPAIAAALSCRGTPGGMPFSVAIPRERPAARAAIHETSGDGDEVSRQTPIGLDTGMVAPWSISFKKGDVSIHKRSVVLSGKTRDGKTDVRFEFRSTDQVEIKDVNARGEATVTWKCTSMAVVRGGQLVPIEGAQFPVTTRVIGKNGLLIRETEGTEAAAEPLLVVEGLLANNPVPPAMVRAGTFWRTELQNRLSSGRRAGLVSHFLGKSTISGIPVVGIGFTVDVPASSAQPAEEIMNAKGTRWLDTATGRVVRTEIEIRNVTFTAKGAPVLGSATIADELVVRANSK